MSNTKVITQQTAEERVKNLYNGEYTLVSTFTRSYEPITLLHECGLKYVAGRAKGFMNEGKNKCPNCYKLGSAHSSGGGRVTEETFLKRFKDQLGSEYTYLNGFVNTKTYVNVKHNECEHEFKVTPHMLLGSKQSRCPKCANAKRGMHLVDPFYLKNIMLNKPYAKEYIWESLYSGNNKDYHKIHHVVCGKSYEVRPNDFQQGYRCPHCALIEIESYLSKEVKSTLTEVGMVFKEEVKFKECRHKNLLAFDILLPESNILIEVDGLQHFRNSGNRQDLANVRKRDLIKNNFVASKPELILIRIPHDIPNEALKELLTDDVDLVEFCRHHNLLLVLNGDIHNNDYYTRCTRLKD